MLSDEDNQEKPKQFSKLYVCTLSPEAQKYALLNLFEDPSTRGAEIASMKLWLDSRPSLHAHRDELRILQFLRGCKFDAERARAKMINYYEMRAKSPEWFQHRDPLLPQIQHLLKLGVFLPLPLQNPNTNIMVIIIRASAHNPKLVTINDVLKVSKMVMELTLATEELVSVYGVQPIIDLSGVSLGHALQMTPSLIKKLVHAWQECYPIRTRSIHFINIPVHVNLVLNIFRRFMSAKMSQRIHVHSRSPNIVASIVPPDIVPEEYGGTWGPLSKLIANWQETVENQRDWFLQDEAHKADLSKKGDGDYVCPQHLDHDSTQPQV